MYSYIIEGGHPLSGGIAVQGSKNAILPMIAAAVVNPGVTVIKNSPDISDVRNMLCILEKTGCKTSFADNTIMIDSTGISNNVLSGNEINSVRASVLFSGAMLARYGQVAIDYPGGCRIGSRPIDYHIAAFEKLGVKVSEDGDRICCECRSGQMKGSLIRFPFPSVGATENAVLAALGANGATVIYNAAREPEIYAFCEMLISMGAEVSGHGTSVITVTGTGKLHDTEYTAPSDRIAAGTYACAAAATGGEAGIIMKGVKSVADICAGIREVLETAGCRVIVSGECIEVSAPHGIKPVPYIKTGPYPEFPTDMQSQIMTVMCMATGTSIIEENIFENRFRTVSELKKMGADIQVIGQRAYINGTGRLTGAEVETKELRGGASLIIAGLAAEGVTKVSDEGYINRGYEDIAGNILSLGGRIRIEEDK